MDLAPHPPPTASAFTGGGAGVGEAAGAGLEDAVRWEDRRGPFRPGRLASARGRLSPVMLKRMFGLGDLLAVAGVSAIVLLGARAPLERPLAEFACLLAGAVVTLWMLRAVDVNRFGHRERLSTHLGKTLLAALAGAAAALFWCEMLAPVAQPGVLAWSGAVILTELAGHALGWFAVRRWREQGRLTPNVVIVGATANAARLIEAALKTREVAVLGIFDDRAGRTRPGLRGRAPPDLHGVPVLGDTRSLLDHKILPFVDTIVITVTSSAEARVRELIGRLSVLPNAVSLFIDTEDEAASASTVARIADAPLRLVSGARFDERRALVKRLSDLALGGAALLVAGPVMGIIALAVRLDSPGPVLFRQRRHGFNSEAITVWKFRSMRHEAADASASRQVSVGDERVTRVGRFIRRTSLDELPQLLNVLRGEMSLVGPRPHAIGMLTAGQESHRLVAEYAWRHRMKPGITGWAQINGSRGPVEDAAAIRRRVALDVEYIERQSFWFDLYILAMTLPRLLGDGEAVR